MGFFDKLKKNIFTLDPNRKDRKYNAETTQVKLDNFNFEQKDFASDFKNIKSSKSFSLENTHELDNNQATSDSVYKQKQKIQKKLDKIKLKELKKQNKIDKYIAGLNKSGSLFTRRLKEIQTRHNKIDEEYFYDLEEVLIMSDISMGFVTEIIDEVKKEVKLENIVDIKLINEIITEKIFIIYTNKSNIDTTLDIKEGRTNIIIIVGVNGSGKTTSIAKLAYKLKEEGKKVIIAAADTFRAGAVSQLNVWANKIGVNIVKPIKDGADPASVVYDAVYKSKIEKTDVLIIDTAGRLQNKVNLMNELAKMNKIIQKTFPEAPHESLLVIDANTGQNAVSQAIAFKEVTPLSGIILTKMDGTSKGGIIFSIKDKLNIAVKFLGLGEKLDDLQEFDLESFIYAMTKEMMGNE